MDSDVVDNWKSVEWLLSDWSTQACLNRDVSARRAKFHRRMHYLLGIPVVIFSSVVGSAAFTQIHGAGNDKVRLLAGILSILSAVLAGLQTFFRFGESAEKYRAVGVGYEKVEKEIEEIQALPPHLRGDPRERVDALREQMNALADGSPEIPDHKHPTPSTLKERRA